MNAPRNVLFALSLLSFCAAPQELFAQQASARWHTSYQDALAEAQRSGRPLLAAFVGTDWCSWCQKLDREVFETQTFARWARDRVVLLEVDFPRRQRLPESLRAQNQQLKSRYGVRGFPTVVVLSGDGSELGRHGYRPGGAKAWIGAVERSLPRAVTPVDRSPTPPTTGARSPSTPPAGNGVRPGDSPVTPVVPSAPSLGPVPAAPPGYEDPSPSAAPTPSATIPTDDASGLPGEPGPSGPAPGGSAPGPVTPPADVAGPDSPPLTGVVAPPSSWTPASPSAPTAPADTGLGPVPPAPPSLGPDAGASPTPGTPEPGAGLRFMYFGRQRSARHENAALEDILRHLPASDGNYFYDADPITWGHETSHGIHSTIRNRRENVFGHNNAFYVFDDRAVIVKEPDIRKSQVAGFIPQSLRGPRFDTYITGQRAWEDVPLYLWDEWNAYVNGSVVGVTMVEQGRWTRGWRDGVAGTLEFTIYALALAQAVERLDPEYFASNTQFREFLAWNTRRAMEIFHRGATLEPFAYDRQERLLENLRSSPDAEALRAFARRTFGAAWTERVLLRPIARSAPEPIEGVGLSGALGRGRR